MRRLQIRSLKRAHHLEIALCEDVREVALGGLQHHFVAVSRSGEVSVIDEYGRERERYKIPYGAFLTAEDGAAVEPGQVVANWDPHTHPIITEVQGTVRFHDFIDGVTVQQQIDEMTGLSSIVVLDPKQRGAAGKDKRPTIQLVDAKGKELYIPGTEIAAQHVLPANAIVTVQDNAKVGVGDVIARIPQESSKTRDITGGLPRVAELFEARKPKDPAVITEIDGSIRFGEIKRGKREIIVIPAQGAERVYEVPVGKHLRVHEGDQVRAGDRLSEGPVNPHDILRIKGPRAVQEYLLNEVQEVYRLQGVKINDKHIGTIVRQMLQKVRITDGGDSEFLEGEHVDRTMFRDVNQQLIAKGKTPARSEPLLLGITKASLTTQSFISAASFQETTRVLTDAAVRGARDELAGLKENIIIGHLIPAGTGIYRGFDVNFEVDFDAMAGVEREEGEPQKDRELFPGLAGVFGEEDGQ